MELRRGSRVRLRPRAGADVFDLALAGQVAVVEAIEEDMEGARAARRRASRTTRAGTSASRAQLGHRFFFAPRRWSRSSRAAPARGSSWPGSATSSSATTASASRSPRGWRARALPPGVDVVDFGIRGMDLAYALGEGYDVAVLLDAAPRGEPPGTLSVIEPEVDDDEPALDAHGMDPVKVLGAGPPARRAAAAHARRRVRAARPS